MMTILLIAELWDHPLESFPMKLNSKQLVQQQFYGYHRGQPALAGSSS